MRPPRRNPFRRAAASVSAAPAAPIRVAILTASLALALAGCGGLAGPSGRGTRPSSGGAGRTGAAASAATGGTGAGAAGNGGIGASAATGGTGASAATPGTGTAGAGDPTVARANRTHEVPTPARAQRPTRGWPTPEAAVRAFAAAYVNWTATTVGPRLRALARESVGQARAMLQLQAGEVAADRELRRGRIANAGAVEAVARLPGAPDRYVVVTRERTTAADDAAYRGLAPAWHVSVATVERVGGRWALSGWQPEN